MGSWLNRAHQIDEGNIEEDPSCHGQYPTVGILTGCTDSHAHKEPDDSRESREEVEEESNVPRHPSRHKDHKVTCESHVVLALKRLHTIKYTLKVKAWL